MKTVLLAEIKLLESLRRGGAGLAITKTDISRRTAASEPIQSCYPSKHRSFVDGSQTRTTGAVISGSVVREEIGEMQRERRGQCTKLCPQMEIEMVDPDVLCLVSSRKGGEQMEQCERT